MNKTLKFIRFHRFRIVLIPVFAAVIASMLLALSREPRGKYDWSKMHPLHPVPVEWRRIADGFYKTELKYKGKTRSQENDVLILPREARMAVFRIDPAKYPVRVITAVGLFGSKMAYLSHVHKKMGALITINGGYFDHEDNPTGQVISDGRLRRKYSEKGGSGALAIVGKVARIDWAINIAYAEPTPDQVLQNGPLMIEPGGKFGMSHVRDKYFPRTVVAIDPAGMLLIGVVRKRFIQDDVRNGLNLYETAKIFHNPVEKGGLGAVSMLNLDGGTSTGMKFDRGKNVDEVKVGIRLPNFVCIMPKKK